MPITNTSNIEGSSASVLEGKSFSRRKYAAPSLERFGTLTDLTLAKPTRLANDGNTDCTGSAANVSCIRAAGS